MVFPKELMKLPDREERELSSSSEEDVSQSSSQSVIRCLQEGPVLIVDGITVDRTKRGSGAGIGLGLHEGPVLIVVGITADGTKRGFMAGIGFGVLEGPVLIVFGIIADGTKRGSRAGVGLQEVPVLIVFGITADGTKRGSGRDRRLGRGSTFGEGGLHFLQLALQKGCPVGGHVHMLRTRFGGLNRGVAMALTFCRRAGSSGSGDCRMSSSCEGDTG